MLKVSTAFVDKCGMLGFFFKNFRKLWIYLDRDIRHHKFRRYGFRLKCQAWRWRWYVTEEAGISCYSLLSLSEGIGRHNRQMDNLKGEWSTNWSQRDTRTCYAASCKFSDRRGTHVMASGAMRMGWGEIWEEDIYGLSSTCISGCKELISCLLHMHSNSSNYPRGTNTFASGVQAVMKLWSVTPWHYRALTP